MYNTVENSRSITSPRNLDHILPCSSPALTIAPSWVIKDMEFQHSSVAQWQSIRLLTGGL